METANNNSQRQTAYKVTIKELNEGKYVKEEGWTPNYVQIPNGTKISRVQIIGVVVSKTESENSNNKAITIDDNTGTITARTFDEKMDFSQIQIGDVVLIVGRVREYNDAMYIVAEIANKNIKPKWAEVWKKEIKKTEEIEDKNKITNNEEIEIENTKIKEENINEKKEEDNITTYIKQKDDGKGVEIQDIIENSGINNSQEKIETMLRKGELFEIQKGIVKVLE